MGEKGTTDYTDKRGWIGISALKNLLVLAHEVAGDLFGGWFFDVRPDDVAVLSPGLE